MLQQCYNRNSKSLYLLLNLVVTKFKGCFKYKAPAEKKGPYYQLSYTHKMRSRTEYVRPEWVDEIQRQIEIYKRFKRLIEQCVELSIDHSQTRMKPVAKTAIVDK